jgi:tetratricopeptide (TPR) repeat protein
VDRSADVAYTREDLPEAAEVDEPLELAPMSFGGAADPAPTQEAIPSGLPASALPASALPASDLPASALPYDSVTDGSGDFSLHMPHEAPDPMEAGAFADGGAHDNEFDIDAAEPAPKRGRRTWLVPVVAGLGVPALFGIYLLANSILSKPGEPAGNDEGAMTPVPEMPPVQAGQGAGEGWVDWDGLHGEETATESGMAGQPNQAAPGAGSTREPVSLQLSSPPEGGMEFTKPEAGKVDPVDAARQERQRREESDAADRLAEEAAARYRSETPEPGVNVAPAPPAPAPTEPPAANPLASLETIKVTAPPAEDHDAVREQVAAVRGALAGKEFERARRVLDKARLEAAGNATAIANLDLWGAITEFEQGNLPDALAKFEKLDRNASYEPSGFGAGAVANWIAWLHLSSGDVRSAVGVLDEVGPADADQYAQARLWEGMALASLGMNELAERTWQRLPAEAGGRVTASGAVAVHTAEFLTGAISEKEYRTSIGDDPHWTNDMHYFLGYVARRENDSELAREHFRRAMEVSQGKEFPYHLAEAEMAGEGLTK